MTLADWKRLYDDERLQRAAAEIDAGEVAAVQRLRRSWPTELVALALTLADARRRLERKFRGAARLWADREAAEQSTAECVAEWKAARLRAAGAGAIEDRCCGMGGDAMSLARDAATTGIDRSDVRAWMTSVNAGCATLVADAATAPLQAPFLHIDPARRDERGGRRVFDLAEHEPSVARCFELAAQARGEAVKLGPGVPLPLPGAERAELEFISDDGALVQAVAWFGALARHAGRRTATMLPAGVTLSGAPARPPTRRDGFRRRLFVPDPALERGELLGAVAAAFDLAEPAPGLGILTGDEAAPSPWLASFEILARPRPRERDVRAALQALGAGGARVRTRGKSADADQWTKALRVSDAPELDVFLLRVGSTLEALIARRT